MNCCCENCGWSEIIGSPIMCNYSNHRTWRDECCEAWKPKQTDETDMVKIVRCKDCIHSEPDAFDPDNWRWCKILCKNRNSCWFCADGIEKQS